MTSADDKVIEYYKSIYARGLWKLDFFEHMVVNRLREEVGLPLEAWQPVLGDMTEVRRTDA